MAKLGRNCVKKWLNKDLLHPEVILSLEICVYIWFWQISTVFVELCSNSSAKVIRTRTKYSNPSFGFLLVVKLVLPILPYLFLSIIYIYIYIYQYRKVENLKEGVQLPQLPN